MADSGSGPVARLARLERTLADVGPSPLGVPWDPDSEHFPRFAELPNIENAPKGSAWVWGRDDNLGRINLLTPTRVKRAADEIKHGIIVSLNLPLDTPKIPLFGREHFEHTIVPKARGIAHDDNYSLNTQSGTQWDGFRHMAHASTGLFYNGTTGDDIVGPNANNKISIEHISNHGIAGRGILLDYAAYADANGIRYDPFTSHEISLESLQACARSQGINPLPQARGGDIRPGDMLFIRFGWTKRYYELSQDELETVAQQKIPQLIGISQGGGVVEWLHDCYFASVAGDNPTFEVWPTKAEYRLHEYLLAMWGVPIGEMLDLERLSHQCRRLNRYTFFVASMPANCPRKRTLLDQNVLLANSLR